MLISLAEEKLAVLDGETLLHGLAKDLMNFHRMNNKFEIEG